MVGISNAGSSGGSIIVLIDMLVELVVPFATSAIGLSIPSPACTTLTDVAEHAGNSRKTVSSRIPVNNDLCFFIQSTNSTAAQRTLPAHAYAPRQGHPRYAWYDRVPTSGQAESHR